MPLLLQVTAQAAPHHHHGHKHPHAAESPPSEQAQAASRQLKDTERQRAAQLAAQQKAASLQAAAASRAATLAQQRTEAVARLREIETKVDDAALRLHEAAAGQRAAEADIRRRARDLNALMPLVLRLSLYPTETVLAAPVSPDKALEGLLITKGLAAEVARQVTELRRKQVAAVALKHIVAQQRGTLDAERAKQTSAASALDAQEAEAERDEHAAQDDASMAAQAAAALAARADTLRGAITAMATAQQQAQLRAVQEAAEAARQQRDTDAARRRVSALGKPAGPGLAGAPKVSLVAGQVAHAWGEPGDDGPSTGVTINTAPASFVSSPCAGRIGFSAPFRSYGRLMIIECGGGYDFVLAGMERLDSTVGTRVGAGEPVGRMPDYDPAKQADKPGLYVELRRNGQPVDPMPYLRAKGQD